MFWKKEVAVGSKIMTQWRIGAALKCRSFSCCSLEPKYKKFQTL